MSLKKRKICNAHGHVWVMLDQEWQKKLDLATAKWWRQCSRCGGVRFFKKEERYQLKKEKVIETLKEKANG